MVLAALRIVAARIPAWRAASRPLFVRPFTATIRASGSIGKVTTEISQRSASTMRRTPVLASVLAPHRAKADRQPVERAGAHQVVHLARPADGRRQPAAHEQAARVLADLAPDADRLGRIVLEQHAHAGSTPARQRGGKGAGLDHVAAEIDLAEQAGIAGKGAVGLDPVERQPGIFALLSELRPRQSASSFVLSRLSRRGRARGRSSVAHQKPERPPGRQAGGGRAHQHQLDRPERVLDRQFVGDLEPGRAAEDEPAGDADGEADRRLAAAARQHIGQRDGGAGDGARRLGRPQPGGGGGVGHWKRLGGD